jgi:hypothetical protein
VVIKGSISGMDLQRFDFHEAKIGEFLVRQKSFRELPDCSVWRLQRHVYISFHIYELLSLGDVDLDEVLDYIDGKF